MYPALVDGAFKYKHPWERETLESRLRALDLDLPKVAWVYEQPDTSTFRYRVYNMVECLRHENPGRIAASWFQVSEIPNLITRVRELDALVLCRVKYDANVARLISIAQANQIPVLFDCDDLVFDIRFVHLVQDTLNNDTMSAHIWDFWFAYFGRIEATAKLCNGGIATNPFLANLMQEVVEGPVHIIPNFMNRQQQSVSDELLAAKSACGYSGDGSIGIGYFSGSPTHSRDFAIAAPALARLMESEDNVRLRIVGYMDNTQGPLSKYANRIEFLPFNDWFNLQRLIAETEINIAPLQDNTFTNCKSELKFFEAAAVGTWTLATPTSTFRDAMKDSTAGQLVRADEWDEALQAALELVRSGDRFAEVSNMNAKFVRQKYGWDRFGDAIEAATLSN